MGETKHTPGPWEVHTPRPETYGPNHQSVIARGPTDNETILICELNTTVRNPWRPPINTLATARLIAAAPELLAVCVALVEDDDVAQGYGGLYAHLTRLRDLARPAIAKATGHAV